MSKTILIIINDAPYGTDKAYNGLRIANQLNKSHSDIQVNIFLMPLVVPLQGRLSPMATTI